MLAHQLPAILSVVRRAVCRYRRRHAGPDVPRPQGAPECERFNDVSARRMEEDGQLATTEATKQAHEPCCSAIFEATIDPEAVASDATLGSDPAVAAHTTRVGPTLGDEKLHRRHLLGRFELGRFICPSLGQHNQRLHHGAKHHRSQEGPKGTGESHHSYGRAEDRRRLLGAIETPAYNLAGQLVRAKSNGRSPRKDRPPTRLALLTPP